MSPVDVPSHQTNPTNHNNHNGMHSGCSADARRGPELNLPTSDASSTHGTDNATHNNYSPESTRVSESHLPPLIGGYTIHDLTRDTKEAYDWVTSEMAPDDPNVVLVSFFSFFEHMCFFFPNVLRIKQRGIQTCHLKMKGAPGWPVRARI